MQSTRLERRSSSWTGISRLIEGPLGWLMTLLVIPVLIVAVLLLPPVSLLDRLQVFTYTRIGVSGGAVADPDGTLVNFPAEGISVGFSANVTSVPRPDFLAGQVNQQLYQAASKLPSYLVAKSPFYQVDISGASPSQVVLSIPIPNDSLPYQTLGLYTWTGTDWIHIPNTVVANEEKIESHLTFVPRNFMVMQTTAPAPAVTADLGLNGALPQGVNVVQEAKAGLYLRGDGALDGAAPPNPTGNTVPVIRNWEGDGLTVSGVRTDLINNLLLDPGQQENQITAIEQKVAENNYPGVIIDYRGVDAAPSARADFVHLMTNLASRLHAAGKMLAVQVEAPVQVSADQWNTWGHDWRALSDVVDKLIIPAPIDPRAYAADGEMDALLSFATNEVERRKVQIQLTGQSIERSGPYLLLKGYQAALKPLLGQVQAATGGAGEIALTLDNPRLKEKVTLDQSIGAYSYKYTDDQGLERTVYIENADSLVYKLQLLQKYNVRDVSLLSAGGDVDPNIWGVLTQFQQGGDLSSTPGPMAVVYTVYDGASKVITNKVVPLESPQFSFTPPAGVGALRIETQLVGGRGEALSAPISTALNVANASAPPAPAAAAADAAAPTAAKATEKVVAKLSATDVLNARSGPGTNYQILGQVNPGGSFNILGKTEAGDWWEIELGDGKSGWVIGQLAKTSGDVASVQVAKDIPAAETVSTANAPAASSDAANNQSANSQPADNAAANPAPAPAPAVSAPPPSGGMPFGYGVQAHMVDNGQAAQAMQVTKAMGFNWIKQQIPWTRFESSPGSIDYGTLDDLVNNANATGLSLLFSIVKAPPWARESGFDGSVEGPPADPATYAKFVGAVAAKYCGSSLKAIEVWNEQNLHYEWGNKPLDANAYMALLAPAYAAIKGACPSMWVISGALTPAGNNPGKAVDDFTYLEDMFKAGVANYADAIGAHPSGYNVPPSVTFEGACEAIQKSGNSFNGACDSPHHSWSFRSTMEGYRNIMNVYGASNLSVVPTEFGWAAGGALHPAYKYADDNDFNEQAQWTVEAYQMMKAWGWVGPAILWNLNFRVNNPGTELAQWGIVDQGWGPLPVYNALQAMPK